MGSRRGFLKRTTAWLAGLSVFCALGLVLACTSPTLPLPPPSLPTVLTGSEPGTYRLVSLEGALPGALVITVSRNEAIARDLRVEATIADDRGSWELEVTASPGDVLDLSQQSGDLRSPTTTVIVR